jgi:hypothetical protein
MDNAFTGNTCLCKDLRTRYVYYTFWLWQVSKYFFSMITKCFSYSGTGIIQPRILSAIKPQTTSLKVNVYKPCRCSPCAARSNWRETDWPLMPIIYNRILTHVATPSSMHCIIYSWRCLHNLIYDNKSIPWQFVDSSGHKITYCKASKPIIHYSMMFITCCSLRSSTNACMVCKVYQALIYVYGS